ncbi:MAG: TlpA family protein disulfide reductase, partial [Candidatus Cyclobacteriaceae bacterium M3_2C_046]
ATWCGPCKVEFEHESALRKVLKENNIQLMYISIDRDDYAERWKNMIKFYDLEGYHIRANKKLQEDLRKINGKNLSIPWYILIDDEGNIVERHANKPSQLKALEEEINRL